VKREGNPEGKRFSVDRKKWSLTKGEKKKRQPGLSSGEKPCDTTAGKKKEQGEKVLGPGRTRRGWGEQKGKKGERKSRAASQKNLSRRGKVSIPQP